MEYELNLYDYWRIIRRRKWILIFTALVVILSTFGYTTTRTPIYQASATVRIDLRQTVAGALLQLVTWSRGDTMPTEARTIRSSDIAEKTAKYLGLIKEGMRQEERAQEIARLQGMLLSEVVEGTNMIEITTTSSDPEEAMKVVNAVAQVYKEENFRSKVEQSKTAREFVEKQLNKIEDRLKVAEEALKEYKEREGSMAVDPQTTLTVERLTQFESRYVDIRAEREETGWKLEQLRGQLNKIKRGELSTIPDEVKGADLVSKKMDLEFQISDLLGRYTEKHPKVVELKQKLKDIENKMRAEAERKTKGQLAPLNAKLNQLKSQEREFYSTISGEIGGLPDKDLQLVRLTRQVKINEDLYSMLRGKYEEAKIAEAEKIGEVSIVATAIAPKRPIFPDKRRNMGIGVLVGLILGLALTFVREAVDTSIGAVEDIESLIKVPVLGIIPHIEMGEKRKAFRRLRLKPPKIKEDEARGKDFLVTLYKPKSPAAEAYRTLRANIQFMNIEEPRRAFVVTSIAPQEGKTMTSCNLAVATAQAGIKTLLVSCNLRHPVVYKIFGLERHPGLTDILLGMVSWEEALKTSADLITGKLEWEEALKVPGLDNLNIITAGSVPPNPSELLNSKPMSNLIDALKNNFEVVIFDSPPILPVADSLILASKLGGVVLVYQIGRVPRRALLRAKMQIDKANTKLWGVVLNDLRPEFEIGPPTYYYYHRYYGAEES